LSKIQKRKEPRKKRRKK